MATREYSIWVRQLSKPLQLWVVTLSWAASLSNTLNSDGEEVKSYLKRPQKHDGDDRFKGEIEESQYAEVSEGESYDYEF